MKSIKVMLIILFLFLLLPVCSGSAQDKINTSFEYSQHHITIYYEFRGDSTEQYDLSIVLKRTSNPDFNLKPGLLTGDFGTGKFANEKRSIIWNLTPQEEDNLTGDDYYFEVTAAEIKKNSGIAWYVYVGGIILGGGGAAAVLLLKKNTANSTGSNSALASPPGRP